MSETTDVTSTLAELERKLRELEQELASVGRRRAQPSARGAPAPQAQAARPPSTQPPALDLPTTATSRMIDEEVEYEPTPPRSSTFQAAADPSASFRSTADSSTAFQAAADSAPYEPLDRPGPTDAQLASLADLRRFRDRLERFAKELTDEYDALLGRVMSSFSARGPQAEAANLPPSVPVIEQPTPSPRPQPPQPPPAPPHQETLFEGRVELGVGPFYDIASLGAFERRLAELPYVPEVSVRRFEASHAVIDLRLAEPIPLVSELRRVLETDFGVRQVAGGRILLTFDDA
jgi:hypothetical protein